MNVITLSALPLCKSGYIKSININTDIKRRLLDMGFAAGELVTPVFKSPLGDPTAYGIMGSVVALRNEITDEIYVIPADVSEVPSP